MISPGACHDDARAALLRLVGESGGTYVTIYEMQD